MTRLILTRTKTRDLEYYYHEDKEQFKMLPPKGYKRKMRDEAEDAPDVKKPTVELIFTATQDTAMDE